MFPGKDGSNQSKRSLEYKARASFEKRLRLCRSRCTYEERFLSYQYDVDSKISGAGFDGVSFEAVREQKDAGHQSGAEEVLAP